MDKNITMDRRYSLNSSHLLTYPIAESTRVNLNGSRTSAHFHWGGTPISLKNRSNSSICLNNSPRPTQQNGTSRNNSVNSPERTRATNVSKIDPRIYADVQSKGLASRIVKYHENGARLHRSMSMNNLYSKPGQFPVVHLKKTELHYISTRQPLSMTRIAPPEKSMFHGNTLSSLLRSTSVVGLHKTNEEISHENRPILHPPPTENDLAPTRSVLDVLKEISRKRINSDDLELSDSTKKYCHRVAADVVDTAGVSNTQQQTRNSCIALGYKRQREQMPCNGAHQQNQQQHTSTSSHVQLQQHSPEQLAKKRLCCYNNDITSSLSSSIYHANKRKFYEQQQRSTANGTLCTTSSLPTAAYETQKMKMQRQQPELRFEQLSKTLSCNTPITPIPATPLNQTTSLPGATARTTSATTITNCSSVTAVPAQRSASEPLYAGKSLPIAPTAVTIQPRKPKLTLFNKQYDEHEEDEKQLRPVQASPKDEECADIQFVKPKKNCSITGTKNPLIERTQKSKLALMLCGLRGELYHGDADKIDAGSSITPTEEKLPVNAGFSVTSIGSAVGSSSLSATNIKTSDTPILISNGILPQAATAVIGTVTSTTATNTIATVNTTTATTATASTTTTTTSLPTLGGFKFKPSIKSNLTLTSAPPAIKTTSPLVGLKLTPQKTAGTANVATFNFTPATTIATAGAGPTNSAAILAVTALPVKAAIAPLPMLGGFSFGATVSGSKPALFNTTATSGAITLPTTSTGGFSFGGSGGTAVSSAFAAPSADSTKITNTATPTFGFNSNLANAVTPTTTVATSFGSLSAAAVNVTSGTLSSFDSVATSKTFSFGAPTTTVDVKVAPPAFGPTPTASMFSSNNNSHATSTNNSNVFAVPTAVKTFAFSGQAEMVASTSSTAAPVNSTNVALPATGFAFTDAASQKLGAATTPFSFGGAAAPQASSVATVNNNAFGFGSGTTTAANNNAFSFGPSVATTAAGTATSVAATKTFNFGSTPAPTSNTQSIFGSGPTHTAIVTSTNNNSGGGPFAFSGVVPATQAGFFSTGGIATTGNAAFSFGAASKSDKPVTAGFSFGGATTANNAAATATNLFGGDAANNTTTTTGIVKPSFSFGGAAALTTNNNNNGNVAAAKSLFGNVGANSGSSNNSFGSLAAASNTNQNKTFAFATTTNAAGAASHPVAGNLFGGAIAAGNSKAASGFSFGGAAANTSGGLHSNKPTAVAAPTAAFSFGGAASNNHAAPFNFGGVGGGAGGASANNSNKSFSFGNSTVSAAGNLFGGAAVPASASVAPPAFNFCANTGGGVALSNVGGNIFAPPPGDRPIRRATRRLQKS